jgi:hypothetical protein
VVRGAEGAECNQGCEEGAVKINFSPYEDEEMRLVVLVLWALMLHALWMSWSESVERVKREQSYGAAP